MADVAATLPSWSSTTSNNSPTDSSVIGAGLADNLQEVQGVVTRWLSHKGADIASASTTDLGAVEGLFHDITGTTTITSFGTVRAGIWKLLKFEGVLTLTHNATSLVLPGNGNIKTTVGDTLLAVSEGSGNWRVVMYMRASGGDLHTVNVLGFGAVGNGVHDDTQAIKDARDYLAALTGTLGTGVLYFPPGKTYLVTDEIEITQIGTHIKGGGKRATSILFNPTATATCFRFTSGASVHYQSSVSGLEFRSTDTTYRKIAIELVDVSEFKISGVNVREWTGNSSKAVWLRGREVVEIDDYDFSCDVPIYIDVNPNSADIGCDHFTLGKGYLYPSSLNYGMTVVSGVPVTRFHIRGQVGCIGGRGLLDWNDTAYTGQHTGIKIENVAIEQQTVGTNYAIDMRMNTGIRNVSFENIQLGQDTNGIRLTKPQAVTMTNVQYDDPAKEFLSITGVSGTVVTFIGCEAQVGSTATMTNLEQRWGNVDAASGKPIRTTSVWSYVNASSADRIEIGNVATREKTGTLGIGSEVTLYGLTPNEGLHACRVEIYSVGATKYADASVSINTVAGAQTRSTPLGDFAIDASAVVAGKVTLVYDLLSAPDVCKIVNGTGESQQYIFTYKFV